ncbi:sigma-70 family RNA polymerase sigma factor [Streptomyces sp. NPDC002889]|uniref:sigma-70 family RNA polymerase sigma factor n=1 Tax=Streptomyces sp. NPDC002889 TaxID=3364669 RepID=UPI00368A8AC2
MSGEGRDELLGSPLDGAGVSETAGHPPRQMPDQSGPVDEHAIPQQRESGGLGKGRSPLRELPVSDAVLVQRTRDGDDSAYEQLFRRHSEAVRRYARTCCRDAHTADDLTAEVFARTLQAVRGGAGPAHAVRAYLLTTVRRVAAAWSKTSKREQLVEDFAVFAAEAARSADISSDGSLDRGADVRAMHEAEQSLAMQAFRSLPERWQAVLWHTTVEEESPSEVAPLFGLTANATAVLAGRAREGLKQAYLQAHVSSALTSGGDCARYADRLGAYARGGLRMRAERGLRKHLGECVRCRLAAGELAHVNAGIPALLPVAVIGWFAAGYALKAAGIVAGGAVAAAGGGASGSASGGSAGGAVAEGLGAPAKAGIAAAAAVAAAAGIVWALSIDSVPAPEAEGRPPAVQPVVPRPSASQPVAPRAEPEPAAPTAPTPPPEPASSRPKPAPAPTPKRTPPTTERNRPAPPAPTGRAPVPSRTPQPAPAPPPPQAPPATEVHRVNRLEYGAFGDHTAPEIRLRESTWLWQRQGMSVAGKQYGHGVTVHATSSLTIDLNRRCSAFDALVGVDDLTLGMGAVRFSVHGDGGRLWRSAVIRGGDAAVPVHVPISGRKTIRLVVEPHTHTGSVALADWARSQITCQ